MKKIKRRAVLVLGPTGVRKTEIAIELAQNYSGEIINSDSMQVYRNMNIGTAKPSLQERKGIPHHLINILEPSSSFSVQDFLKRAKQSMEEIWQRGKLPLIVGGTGMYLHALLNGLSELPCANPSLRKNLLSVKEKKGLAFLYQKLQKLDPKRANQLHANDQQRILRSLELFLLTQKTFDLLTQEKSRSKPTEKIDFLCIGLTMERSSLYQKLEQRCDQILNKGLIEEVERLKQSGLDLQFPSMKGIGYQHMFRYLIGEWTRNEAIRLFKRDTRRLAKRQWTIFSKIPQTSWYNLNTPQEPKKTSEEIIQAQKKDLQEKLELWLEKNKYTSFFVHRN